MFSLPTSFPSLAFTVPPLVCACPPGPFLFPPGPLPFQSLVIFLLPVILCTCGLLVFCLFVFFLFLTPFVSPISLLTLAMSPACPLVCLPPLAGALPRLLLPTWLLCFHLYLALPECLGLWGSGLPASLPHAGHLVSVSFGVSFLGNMCVSFSLTSFWSVCLSVCAFPLGLCPSAPLHSFCSHPCLPPVGPCPPGPGLSLRLPSPPVSVPLFAPRSPWCLGMTPLGSCLSPSPPSTALPWRLSPGLQLALLLCP